MYVECRSFISTTIILSWNGRRIILRKGKQLSPLPGSLWRAHTIFIISAWSSCSGQVEPFRYVFSARGNYNDRQCTRACASCPNHWIKYDYLRQELIYYNIILNMILLLLLLTLSLCVRYFKGKFVVYHKVVRTTRFLFYFLF